MFNIVLYEPEIAPNTGNIIRLCANTGTQLHLIEPLGFSPDEKKLRRAGLDYHDWVKINIHKNYDSFLSGALSGQSGRIFTVSTHHTTPYSEPCFKPGDTFLFGSETRGLPTKVRDSVPQNQRIRIPMMPNNRSLNLSNSVAITVYEAWRQAGFADAQ